MPPHTDTAAATTASSATAPPQPTILTPTLLRDWSLPSPGGSKYGRGEVLVVGGARQTPGAALLAGLSALRVGAGRLTVAVAESVAVALAVAVPEAGVVGLPETADGSVIGASAGDRLAASVERADAVLIGSGLDDPEETAALLRAMVPLLGSDTSVVLDAFALGVLIDVDEVVEVCGGRLVLTPNEAEAARLLTGTTDPIDDLPGAVLEIASRYRAVVSCRGWIADPRGSLWQVAHRAQRARHFGQWRCAGRWRGRTVGQGHGTGAGDLLGDACACRRPVTDCRRVSACSGSWPGNWSTNCPW